MEIIKETSERTWYLVMDWITPSGLRARIHQCVWSEEVRAVASSLHPHYCGYVCVPEGTTIDEEKIDIHGGVTFSLGPLMEGVAGNWIGFDMAHLGDEHNQDLEYAIEECVKLAEQIKLIPRQE